MNEPLNSSPSAAQLSLAPHFDAAIRRDKSGKAIPNYHNVLEVSYSFLSTAATSKAGELFRLRERGRGRHFHSAGGLPTV
jgi:hypothetical protein